MIGWLALALAAAPMLPSLGAVRLAESREQLGLRTFETGTPRCPAARTRCFGVVAHVVEEGGAPVRDAVWFSGQIAQANRLFEPIDVGFEVVAVEGEPADRALIGTRTDRDLLGRADHDNGRIHVYVVRRLADVDIEGEEIRGVHWRDRAETSRRWIILSSIAGDLTLAHELGHFFGLPHSGYAESLMNKTPRDLPWSERRFHDKELARMRGRRDAMVAGGVLVDRAR
jgi:hypothetical protein